MTEDESRARVVRLLAEHRSVLFSFIYTAVRDFDVAEDVFQEVSVAVCESYAAFEPGSNFGAWAREIARRRILAQWRAEKRFPALLSDEALGLVEAGFAEAEKRWTPRDRIGALRVCLEKLAPPMRRMVELRYGHGLRLDAIGDQVGRRGETVRKALYVARRTLRECIQRTIRAEERR